MKHPYYPLSLQLPTFVANTLTVQEILGGFFACVALIIVATLRFAKNNTVGDRWAAVWFAVCGFIHCLVEGYYVLNNYRIPSDQSILGQLWKEYSLADSRYLTSDPAVLSIEILTAAVMGPLSFILAGAIVKSRPYRHFLQILVSTSQLYGCCLYYMTSYLTQFKDSHPHPFYFYGYFVVMNLPWIVLPIVMINASARATVKAFSATSKKIR